MPTCLDVPDQALRPTSRGIRRVLFVSYHFPPVGGAGVQRPVKFVKYLREFGWEASVLIAANPSVPVFDQSLCADLPDDLVIARARTWEPGYGTKRKMANAATTGSRPDRSVKSIFRRVARHAAGVLLQPDAQILWVPSALRAGTELLRRLPHQAILATAPPYSNLLLGTMLKKQFGLPLVADFRDEWDLSSQYLENSQRDWFSRVVQERMQQHVLRRADTLVATTRASTARLLERAGSAGSRADAHCIYNGFDPCDFERGPSTAAPASNSARRFRLTYTGTLWNLTTVAPIVEAIELLRRDTPQAVDRLELTFVGRKTPPQRDLLKRIAATGCTLQDVEYCDHEQAIDLMLSADGLCLLLSDLPGADRVAPAKLFEYLATGKPLLAVTPEGETAQLVRQFVPDGHFLPSDVQGIARWLKVRAEQFDPASASAHGAQISSAIAQFSRRHEAGQLAELLDGLDARFGKGGSA